MNNKTLITCCCCGIVAMFMLIFLIRTVAKRDFLIKSKCEQHCTPYKVAECIGDDISVDWFGSRYYGEIKVICDTKKYEIIK